MKKDTSPPAARPNPELIIITGLSGAGKSSAMRVFEDLGYYCLDNLPPGLIPRFFALYSQSLQQQKGEVIASDVRSGALFDEFQNTVAELNKGGIPFSILYLDCASEILVNRFKEVRRSHPLEPEYSIMDAIEEERRRLIPIRDLVTDVIDTSHLSPAAFRQEVLRTVTGQEASASLRFRFVSFGFKYGIPQDADFVFDVRFLPNPFYNETLRPLTGEHAPVYNFIMASDTAEPFFTHVCDLLDMTLEPFVQLGKLNITVAIGCTGGHHRSVAFATRLASHYTSLGRRALTVHRDIKKPL